MTEYAADSIELTLVPVDGTDSVALDRLTGALACELRELRLDSVERCLPSRSGPPGPAASSAVLTDVGKLSVGGLLSGSGVKAMVGLVQSWLRRNEQDSVILRLGEDHVEITGSPTRRSHQLLKDFYRRHGEDGC
ncbi:hypothetical protein [Actinopolyspora saharensis]|uniref:Uncharacterized protein n=1 Tax=Actinopolyspora saharensis TaxID=995062 RepID=A0A1H1DAY4_9ACTN|nr:hypothetical protein [Actinopolyspora saharensis]SDQ73359.1 hypothetical protein SAMN04489718_1979 [Actinopolyspora saharensis]